MAFRNKTPLYQLAISKLLLAQVLMSVVIAVVFLLAEGINAAGNAMLGGLIVLLPNIYFALKAFRYFGAQSALAITLAFWSGEMGKYVLTVGLFVFVFLVVKPNNFIALFMGYFAVLMVSALGLLLVKKSFRKY
ncbi:hypothetical protein DKL61_15410 [Gammaproteobacteria bacterium ESL0073]|nr:hypothetical protein DKL61_15410 [Gammaproteobacteria bacterium ESL0073]